MDIKGKKFHSSRLTERFRDAKLPDYEIIKIKKSEKKGTFISEELIEKVNAVAAAHRLRKRTVFSSDQIAHFEQT